MTMWIVAAPVRAGVSFLPANASPVLLLMDGATLTPEHIAAIRALDYTFEPDVIAECSATEYGLLVSRIRLAPTIVAVLAPADHDLVVQALHDAAYELQFEGPLLDEAAARQSLLEPLRHILGADAGSALLGALVARRRD
jgi:hypothetical protein